MKKYYEITDLNENIKKDIEEKFNIKIEEVFIRNEHCKQEAETYFNLYKEYAAQNPEDKNIKDDEIKEKIYNYLLCREDGITDIDEIISIVEK